MGEQPPLVQNSGYKTGLWKSSSWRPCATSQLTVPLLLKAADPPPTRLMAAPWCEPGTLQQRGPQEGVVGMAMGG
jgi:hypothetical protein